MILGFIAYLSTEAVLGAVGAMTAGAIAGRTFAEAVKGG